MDSGGVLRPTTASRTVDAASHGSGASTATDPPGDADSEGEGLETMTTPTIPMNISEFEDTATADWLAEALAPARRRGQDMPTADAVARMRARIFVETEKKDGKIAA